MSESAVEPIEIELIADLACPWCYIGLVRLDRARALRPHLPVRLRWWPYLLNPHLPVEGMDRATYLRLKFGGEAAAGQIYERIRESGRAAGIEFGFERMARTPNTVAAQRLLLYAQAQGMGEALMHRLFQALFQEGRDIGDRQELLELAVEAGLERDPISRFLDGDRHAGDVRAAHQRAERMGVRGVPMFIFDREQGISGAQPAEVLVGLLDLAARARAEAVP